MVDLVSGTILWSDQAFISGLKAVEIVSGN